MDRVGGAALALDTRRMATQRTEQEQRAACARVAERVSAGESVNAAAALVGESVNAAGSTLRGWAQKLAVELYPGQLSESPEDRAAAAQRLGEARAAHEQAQPGTPSTPSGRTSAASRASGAYGAATRAQQRQALHDAIGYELAHVQREQSIRAQTGELLLNGVVTGTSKDGRRITIRARAPDHAGALRNLAVTHAILRQQAHEDSDGAGSPDPAQLAEQWGRLVDDYPELAQLDPTASTASDAAPRAE